MNEVYNLGETLAAMNKANPWPNIPLLPAAMMYLMTELWDRGFTQAEIREAFDAASGDVARYSGGEERRR